MYNFIQKIKFRKRSDIIIKLLDPKNDYVFKRIFGHTGNEDITKSFLSSIIPDKIEKIELDCNPIMDKDLLDDKLGILDIKARLNDNVVCNVEMQICDKKNIEKRLLFYWSKMYSQGIKQGQDYDELKRTIVILISDYNLEKLKKIPEYVTKWNIREEKYGKIILTDVLEIYIIELNKLKNGVVKDNQKLNSWLYFIKSSKVVVNKNMREEDIEEIKKAQKILEDISADEHEKWLAEMRLKYIRDKHAIEDFGYDKGYKSGQSKGIEIGKEQGIEQGIEIGKEQGIEIGSTKKQEEIARNLKQENVDIQFIARVTGLTEEEIEKIK